MYTRPLTPDGSSIGCYYRPNHLTQCRVQVNLLGEIT